MARNDALFRHREERSDVAIHDQKWPRNFEQRYKRQLWAWRRHEMKTGFDLQTASVGAPDLGPDLALLIELFKSTNYSQFDQLAADWTTRFPRKALGWKLLGASLLERGLLGQALAPLHNAVMLDAVDPESQVNYANALFLLGRVDEARTFYEGAVRTSERAISLILSFSKYLTNSGMDGSAEQLLTQLQTLAPADTDVLLVLGNLVFKAKRWSEAEQLYRCIVLHSPDSAPAHSNLAACLKHQGKLAQAEAHCLTALTLDPLDADALNNYGAVLLELGRFVEAETVLRKAVDLKPADFSAHLNLGVALKEQRRRDDAKHYLEIASRLNAHSADAIANLADLLDREPGVEEARKAYLHALDIDPRLRHRAGWSGGPIDHHWPVFRS